VSEAASGGCSVRRLRGGLGGFFEDGGQPVTGVMGHTAERGEGGCSASELTLSLTTSILVAQSPRIEEAAYQDAASTVAQMPSASQNASAKGPRLD
jgi:hypothetical protein